jgi:hypothetical protein
MLNPVETTQTRKKTPSALAFAFVTVIAALALLLVPLSNPWQQAWRQKALDLAHLPLFALVTCALYRAAGRSWPRAVLAASLVALAGELGQWFAGRWANAEDFVRGLLGCLLSVLLWWCWRSRRSAGRCAAAMLAVLAVLAWPVADAGPILLDAWYGHQQFPVLCDFSGRWETLRWHTSQARLLRTDDPEITGLAAARLEFQSGSDQFAAATLTPVVPNWSGRRRLCVQVEVADEPIELYFKVRDYREANEYFDRFNGRRRLPPGRHTVSFSLTEIAGAPRGTPLDLAAVHSLEIFTSAAEHGRSILVLALWLE